MREVLTVVFLIISNVFMTFAWYGNLKLQQLHPSVKDWPLILFILMSWGVAQLENSFMNPANKIGSQINGGLYSLLQLKIIQEAVSLIVFPIVVLTVLRANLYIGTIL